MYIACKTRSGFPGTMPAGSESDADTVSVQAILEGLGLIHNPGGESPSYDSFDTNHTISFDKHSSFGHVTDTSKSTTPSRGMDDMILIRPPDSVSTFLPSPLPTQRRTPHDDVAASSVMAPALQQNEYPGHNCASCLSNPIHFTQGGLTATQTQQIPSYQGGFDSSTPSWLGSTATPLLGNYDYSYAY